MLIKHHALAANLRKKLSAVYFLIGSDTYLFEDAIKQIKKAYSLNSDYEEKKININSVNDWQIVSEEANSYALFSENTLIEAYYDKKSLESCGKTVIDNYLKSVNPRCLILIRAPELAPKQLQLYNTQQNITVVSVTSLDNYAMQQWIKQQLQSHNISYAADIPDIIQQYTEGNMLATAQVIEKIQLTTDENSLLTVDELMPQLSIQSNYQLYDLSNACLDAKADKALRIIRHAAETRVEPTLILWLLSNELRLLLQLHHKVKQGISFHEACNQLKIWSTKINFYKKMLQRLPMIQVQALLKICFNIDEYIKSSQNSKIWQCFENIVLTLCLGI